MSLEMANKVIVPQNINYVPQFLKQREINFTYRLRRSVRGGWRGRGSTVILTAALEGRQH